MGSEGISKCGGSGSTRYNTLPPLKKWCSCFCCSFSNVLPFSMMYPTVSLFWEKMDNRWRKLNKVVCQRSTMLPVLNSAGLSFSKLMQLNNFVIVRICTLKNKTVTLVGYFCIRRHLFQFIDWNRFRRTLWEDLDNWMRSPVRKWPITQVKLYNLYIIHIQPRIFHKELWYFMQLLPTFSVLTRCPSREDVPLALGMSDV